MNTKKKHLRNRAAAPGNSGEAFRRWLGRSFLLLFLGSGLTACDDDYFKIKWEESPDTAIIYSLARPELNLYSGFDFLGRTGVKIESPQAVDGWDLVLDTRDGDLVFLPPGAAGVRNSAAAIAPIGAMAFADLKKAPRDTTLYIGDRSVPITVGHLYVIRSRRATGIYGSSCSYFGKFMPLAKNLENQSVTLMFDISPVCNDRKLIPPKD